MTFELQIPFHVVQFMALFTRISAILFLGVPALSSNQIPFRVKAATALIASYIFLPLLPPNWNNSFLSPGFDMWDLVAITMNELMLGIAIALVIRLLMEVVNIAGLIIDRNLGYAMATVFDPALEESSTIITTLLMQAFTVLFLTLDVHLDFVRMIAVSLEEVGPGAFVLNDGFLQITMELGKQMFQFGFKMALPIFTIIMFTNIAMALMARFGQEFEVMMLSFPIRLGAGLLFLMALIPVFISIFRDLNHDILDWVSRVISL